MPELTDKEPLAEAFFRFRLDAPHEIAVPGAAAARRTVAHRRSVRVAAAALIAVAVLLGAGYAGSVIGRDSSAPADLPITTDTAAGPTLDPDGLQQLGLAALGKLGIKPEDARTGTVFGPVTETTDGWEYSLGSDALPFPEGRYQLSAVCLGQGTIQVFWNASGSSGSTGVVCGDSAGITTSFHSAQPGLITLRVVADERAENRAGMAIVVTDPLVVRAQNALATPPLSPGLGGSGFAPTGAVDESGGPVGVYTLTVACAGEGSLRATFTLGAATTSRTVPCTHTPQPIDIPLTSTRADAAKIVELEPDAVAIAAAGYAFHVTG